MKYNPDHGWDAGPPESNEYLHEHSEKEGNEMILFTKAIEEKLLENGRTRPTEAWPVVKLFTPDAGATWLLTELDPNDPDIAFGRLFCLCNSSC